MDMKKRCDLVLACVVITFLCLAGCFPQKKVAVPQKPVAVPPAPEIKPPRPAEPEPPSSRPKPHLVKLLQEEYPDFRDDLFFSGLGKALNQSLAYFRVVPDNRVFQFGNDRVSKKRMVESLTVMLDYMGQTDPEQDFNDLIRKRYDVYKSVGNDRGEVLFTGYYEPCLRGSLEKSDEYPYPVFAAPDDLVSIDLRAYSDEEGFNRTLMGRVTDRKTVVPYYERKEIGRGDILKGKARIIAYVSDRIDLFFLEVQGSGILYLDNGDVLKLHFSNKNGRPYRSIGNYMVNTGRIPAKNISMQTIKAYLRNNPGEVDEILNFNPSYVFFTEGKGGPYGCYGVEVTAERSIATDKPLFPACALAFIQTSRPVVDSRGKIVEWGEAHRLVLNQDTGGAIKGPGRVDLFMGNGSYAELAAGHMKHNGSLYFLVLKEQPDPPVSP